MRKVAFLFGIHSRTVALLEDGNMRLLSGYEEVLVERTRQGIYNCFTVGAEYTVALDKAKIVQALTVLVNKFPQFSLAVDGRKVVRTSVDVETMVVEETGSVEDILKKYVLQEFAYDGAHALWKVVFAKALNTVFFVVDHTFFDGTAAKNFHAELAKALAQDGAGTSRSSIVDEEYPDPTVMMGFQDRQAGASAGPPSTALCADMDRSLLQTPMSLHHFKIVNIPPEMTGNLLQFARNNNIKITALLYAVVAKVLVGVVGKNDPFKAMIPINTRPSDVEREEWTTFGVYFGKYFHTDMPEAIANTPVVDLALDFQKKLVEAIPKAMEGFEVSETTARLVPESSRLDMKAMAEQNDRPGSTIAMSNLGVLSTPITNNVYFDQPLVNACFALHFISTPTAGLSLNFIAHRAVSTDVHEAFVKQSLEMIDSIGGS